MSAFTVLPLTKMPCLLPIPSVQQCCDDVRETLQLT